MSIEVVVIVAGPGAIGVGECLDLYARNVTSWARHPQFILVDAAESAAQRNEHRAHLLRIHRKHRLDTLHASPREVDSTLKKLALSPVIDDVKYALGGDYRLGYAYEAILNRAMVAVDGRSALFVSANSRPAIRLPGGVESRYLVKPRAPGSVFDPYRRGPDLWKHGNAVAPALRNLDVVKVMGGCLDKEFTECADSVTGRAKGKVKIVTSGRWGCLDLPYSTPGFLAKSRTVAGNEDEYMAHRDSAQGWVSSNDWVASTESALSPHCFAVSSEWKSFPFLPTGGASSVVSIPGFVQSAFWQQLTMEAPHAFEVVGAKMFSPGSAVAGASRMSLHDLILVLMEEGVSSHHSNYSARALIDLSESSDEEMDRSLRVAANAWAATMRDRARSKLASYSGSSATAVADMQAVIDTYGQMLEDDDYPMPYEIRSGDFAFESRKILRRQLFRFGSLALNWDLVRRDVQSVGLGVRP